MAALHRTYWLTSPCRLRRRDGTVLVERDDQPDVRIPIDDIRDLVATAPVDLNTSIIGLLNRHDVVLHVLDHYGNYAGTVAGDTTTTSGLVAARQAAAASDGPQRRAIAAAIVEASARSTWVVLGRPSDLTDHLEALRNAVASATTREEAMGAEGLFARHVWSMIDSRLPEHLQLSGRTRRPPDNAGNAFVSYVNSIVYGVALTAVRTTPLISSIGFLHANNSRRRHPLALDLAELLKPLITLRLLLRLGNRGQLPEDIFDAKTGNARFTDSGRRAILTHVRDHLDTTFDHPTLDRPTTLHEAARIEALKVTRTVTEGDAYEPLTAWW